jgi:hypothetical protein
MANTSPNSSPTPAAPLKQRLDRLQAELAAQRRSLNRSSTLTAILGLIVLGALAAYFYYGYTQIAYAAEPEQLVSVAETLIDDNLPKARASLEKEVDKNAGKWAESLSKKARASLPDLRVKAEAYFVEQVDKSLDESAVVTDQHFRNFVKENRPLLEKAFKDLEKNPKLADESLAELENALDKELQTDLRVQAQATFDALTQLNEKLKKLRAGKNLSAEEQTERELVMIVRRLQLDNPGSVLPRIESGLDANEVTPVSTKPANPAKAPAVKQKEPLPAPKSASPAPAVKPKSQ